MIRSAALGLSILLLRSATTVVATEPTGKRWVDMDYGTWLSASVEAPARGATDDARNDDARNFAYKGIIVRVHGETSNTVSSSDDATLLFDTDLLRYACGWTGGLLDQTNIAWDGSHGTHAKIDGTSTFTTAMAPGWARPSDGSRNDPRELPYGPLPRDWAHWKGLWVHSGRVVLSYTVGDARVLELAEFESRDGGHTFFRDLEIDGATTRLALRASDRGPSTVSLCSFDVGVTTSNDPRDTIVVLGNIASLDDTVTALVARGASAGARWEVDEHGVLLELSPAAATQHLSVSYTRAPASKLRGILAASVLERNVPQNHRSFTRGGGGPSWAQPERTTGQRGSGDGAFVVDEITPPFENRWNSWMRLGGFDFFAGGKQAAVCTWMGDVWIVDGIDDDLDELVWRRAAAGLFQPLGLRIVDGKIYVLGRDQITVLRDVDGDGETDFYENFNNDAQVTEHFHEFAMDLQTDARGDFFYTKGGRHALDAVVPQHGTIIRVPKDGSRAEILAKGFRAPNGLAINPDGSFLTSDQEGHWTPANRINWVRRGSFNGYAWSYFPDGKPTTFEAPLCWIHPKFDRSPAAQVWVPENRWGPLAGKLLTLSYGTGDISHVLFEKLGETVQGGVVRLDVPAFPTGVMRGRFHPDDGHLYVCGLFGWAGNRTQSGGFYRLRYTGRPLHTPVELHATEKGLVVVFDEPLDPRRARESQRYAIDRWNYRWAPQYGSKDYRVSDGSIGRDPVTVRAARLSKDGRSVLLEIDDLTPCMQMHLRSRIQAADGARISPEIYSTVHVVGPFAPWADRFE